MALIINLNEIKGELEIDTEDTQEDRNLTGHLVFAADMIETAVNRKGRLWHKSRTEFYDGTGTQKILLKSRPVYPCSSVRVWVDEGGAYGSVTDSFDQELTYGTDFCLRLDDGERSDSSLTGILLRLRAEWTRLTLRSRGLLSPYLGPGVGNVKVTYSGGYTVDDLPEAFRKAAVLLVAKMRFLMPLGLEMNSDSYEDKSVAWQPNQKDYLMGLIRPLLAPYRNWNF